MFPNLARPDEEAVNEGGVLHAPYSDGYDDGFDPSAPDARRLYRMRTRDVGRASLAGVVARLRPRVTRVVYTFLVAWALDVARDAGVPAALYWIQPATVFAVYHRCFIGGHGDALAAACAGGGRVELPGLPAMTGDALPSIVSATSPEHPMHGAFQAFRDLFADIDEHRPKVLVNTFDALEPDALRAVPELEVVAVWPAVPDDVVSRHLRDVDATAAEGAYMAWLDTKAARSVVYVSFGSFVPMNARQEEEMKRGLEAAGRPYLWACTGATKQDDAEVEKEQEGMVVAWCEQVRVLSHPAVGCFVTHCGWNSALESMACGVPLVALPQWTDQPTVAWLLAERAGVGVRARPAVAGDGVVEAAELQRCVDAVMGDGQRAAEIRAYVERRRELGREAVASGGSSERNLRAFAQGL